MVTPAAQQPAKLFLRRELEAWQACFAAQPSTQQRFLEVQARQLAAALAEPRGRLRFALPDQVVVVQAGFDPGRATPVPAGVRAQHLGGLLERLTHADLSAALGRRLDELEHDPDPAIATAAGLLRYATARHMLHVLLPTGQPVAYVAAEGEEIPATPVRDVAPGALTAGGDAVVEAGPRGAEPGELQAAFVPAARRFFLPQWVIVDDLGRLLVNSVAEAEALLASMQRYVAVLQVAVGLAPYLVADPEYQRKRYGMLGQLVNQGRALARYETEEMIRLILRRAAAHDLNRGLSLSVPYFDDEALAIRTRDFSVIPAGRIMFLHSFVAWAARTEHARVAQDICLSPSTRRHLLGELRAVEQAFARALPARRVPAVSER
jgi:hypothetical protein